MSDQFVAEIRIFPFNFAPTGWAFCSGQLMPISQNTALFSLLGTTYGGDGKTTFALPDLQGCVPMHPGQGTGLSDRALGEAGGIHTHTLLESEIPLHAHFFLGANPTDFADLPNPAPDRVVGKSQNALGYQTNTSQNLVQLAPQALGVVGADLPHNNLMPHLTLNFCIALQGTFPTRGGGGGGGAGGFSAWFRAFLAKIWKWLWRKPPWWPGPSPPEPPWPGPPP